MMNQDFAWDFNYLRDSKAAENTLDFVSVALHETGHILGFTSSLDFIFVGWVKRQHKPKKPDKCWVLFLNPTYFNVDI